MLNQVKYYDGNIHPCYFFWKTDDEDGYMSNWYHSEFVMKDTVTKQDLCFNSSEQYFMWAKAKLFGDEETAQKIYESGSCREQKDLGRQVKNFDQLVWNQNKYQIMVDAIYYKFVDIANIHLKESLVATGNAILAEASPYDKIWGIGVSTQTTTYFQDVKNWKGENLLGKALMEVRDKLKNR